jgi:plastocyanin
MDMRTTVKLLTAAALALALAALGAACTGGGEEGEEPAAAPATSATIRAVRALKWDRNKLTVAAGQPVTITMVNEDTGVPHDLVIYRDPARTQIVAKTEQCTAPCQEELRVTLPADKYYYNCSIHPVEMRGELEAK